MDEVNRYVDILPLFDASFQLGMEVLMEAVNCR